MKNEDNVYLQLFTTLSLTGNFTSDSPSMPEEVPKQLQKLLRNMTNNSSILETDRELSWLLPSSHSNVSISPTSGHRICL